MILSMKIAICEDQVIQIDLLNEQIKKWAKEKDIDILIDNFTTAEAFLFEWSDYNKYDIVFLDIKLSKMSGIELSNIIREKNKNIDIVFVTGFCRHDSYFLLKIYFTGLISDILLLVFFFVLSAPLLLSFLLLYFAFS